MTNLPLLQAYRCLEDIARFDIDGPLPERPAYFRYGDDICYGRSCAAPVTTPSHGMPDISMAIHHEGDRLRLPFDPNEVITNLTHERYVPKAHSLENLILHNAYYFARPLLPVHVRRYLQALRLRGSRRQPFPHWPLDCTVDRILEKLLVLALHRGNQASSPFLWFWPYTYSACAIVTHDVETEEGLRFCRALMDIDDSFGIKSSFQLVPEQRYKIPEQLLDEFRDRSFEINIHDLTHDGHLYSDRSEFLRRVARINEYARTYGAQGFRSAALYRNLDWYDSLDFQYDMSVPTVGHLEAQQGGCCTVRPYFIGDLVELPLTTTQDYSMFHILGDYSINLWKQQISAIVERNGLVSCIFHPDYLKEKRAQNVYRQLLAYLCELRAMGKLWIALPGEAASWWRRRSLMSVEAAGEVRCESCQDRAEASIVDAHVSDAGLLEYRFRASAVKTGDKVQVA